MREIKFRAWVGKTEYDIIVGKFGTFYVNPGAKGDGLDERDSATLTPFNTKLDNCPVMQYTGLKDIIMREIYEGDILMAEVREFGQTPEQDTWVNVKGFAEWSDHANGFVFRAGEYEGNSESWHFYQVRNPEKIGNIYENPELLIAN